MSIFTNTSNLPFTNGMLILVMTYCNKKQGLHTQPHFYRIQVLTFNTKCIKISNVYEAFLALLPNPIFSILFHTKSSIRTCYMHSLSSLLTQEQNSMIKWQDLWIISLQTLSLDYQWSHLTSIWPTLHSPLPTSHLWIYQDYARHNYPPFSSSCDIAHPTIS